MFGFDCPQKARKARKVFILLPVRLSLQDTKRNIAHPVPRALFNAIKLMVFGVQASPANASKACTPAITISNERGAWNRDNTI
jgi:hypothetical protein